MKLNYENVCSVLAHSGPLTMREVAGFFPDEYYPNVSSLLSAMRKRLKTKRVHIHHWTREGVGRKYLRAVYALGNRPDARKPPTLSASERRRAHKERKKLPTAPNSVWQLGAML